MAAFPVLSGPGWPTAPMLSRATQTLPSSQLYPPSAAQPGQEWTRQVPVQWVSDQQLTAAVEGSVGPTPTCPYPPLILPGLEQTREECGELVTFVPASPTKGT